MKKHISFYLLLILCINISINAQADIAILFIIDGISWKAPQKLNLPNLESMMSEGVCVEKSYTVVPYHPTIGVYAERYSCSFPNPVLQSGTLFITDTVKMVQQVFWEKGMTTAHVVNSSAYTSINDHYNYSIMKPGDSDESVVKEALNLLRKNDIHFMRIHLQQLNGKGYKLSFETNPSNPEVKWTDSTKPYFRNIWGEGSPYIRQLMIADSLLGVFVSELKKMGMWGNTLLIVTGDNGHSDTGWHPFLDEDAWACPLVIIGPGISKNKKFSYAEHTDIIPTICSFMGLDIPNPGPGSGKVLNMILENNEEIEYKNKYLLKFNKQIKDFNMLKSKLMLASQKDPFLGEVLTGLENKYLTPEPFYGVDRYLEWSKAGSVKHLIEANQKVLDKMSKALKDSPVYEKYK